MRATAARADDTAEGGRPESRRRPRRRRPSAFSQPLRRLGKETLAIGLLLVVAGALVYHFGVRHLHNPRPLGGRNVDVSRAPGVESQASIAVAPGDPRVLVAAANDDSVAVSGDGGRTWTRSSGPDAAIGACPHRTPRVAVDRAGRQYLAWLAGRLCDDTLTAYVVVAARTEPGAPWHVTRVTRPAWTYGFDDGPDLAVDPRGGAVYVAFERSFGARRATTVVARSDDHGRTWSRPVPVSQALVRPHLVSLAVAGHDLYVAGIDAAHGVWVARSTDGGRSFGPVRTAARLAQNPAPYCSLAVDSPVPREETRCTGPDPTVLAHGGVVAVVYGDGGANGAGDVFASLLDRRLRPRGHRQVNPPDRGGSSRQFMPVAAVDADTGVFWACWYDSAYGDGGHAWFTCAASRNGRRWSPPERAAGVPSDPGSLYADAAKYGFYPGLAAADGTAHPVWIDTRRPDLLEEVYTAALRERSVLDR